MLNQVGKRLTKKYSEIRLFDGHLARIRMGQNRDDNYRESAPHFKMIALTIMEGITSNASQKDIKLSAVPTRFGQVNFISFCDALDFIIISFRHKKFKIISII